MQPEYGDLPVVTDLYGKTLEVLLKMIWEQILIESPVLDLGHTSFDLPFPLCGEIETGSNSSELMAQLKSISVIIKLVD